MNSLLELFNCHDNLELFYMRQAWDFGVYRIWSIVEGAQYLLKITAVIYA